MAYKDPETERACQRRCYRRVTDERTAQGLCPKCGKAEPEPGRRLCRRCGGKRRAADRARYAKAKAAGLAYGGGNVEAKRKAARAKTKRRYDARRAAGLCTKCGKRPPVEGSMSCGACKAARNARERTQWDERRAAGLCGACGVPSPSGTARCESCAAIQAGRPSRKLNGRKRYARRRARNLCTDCGAWAGNAARCDPCARRSYARSAEHRGLPRPADALHRDRDRHGHRSRHLRQPCRSGRLPRLRQARDPTTSRSLPTPRSWHPGHRGSRASPGPSRGGRPRRCSAVRQPTHPGGMRFMRRPPLRPTRRRRVP